MRSCPEGHDTVSRGESSRTAVAFGAPTLDPRRFRRRSSGWESGFSAILSAPPVAIEVRGSPRMRHVRVFGPVEGPTMPSADFSLRANETRRPFRREARPPWVSRHHLHPYVRRIYDHTFRAGIGLWASPLPHPVWKPRMRFLFVGPELCLALPSDSTSRWTPLRSANGSPCGARRGLTPPSEWDMPGARGTFAFGSDTVFGVNAISQEHGSGGRGCMVFQNGRWHRQR